MTDAPDNVLDALPGGLTDADAAWPVVHIPPEGDALPEPRKLNAAVARALEHVWPDAPGGQALIKVHVGEPKTTTAMRPGLMDGPRWFLLASGATGVVAGDTTVAYTGPRGHQDNPPGDAHIYQALAAERGWSPEGESGLRFVVLDRPSTSVEGAFVFDDEERRVELEGVERFRDFFVAGGFAAADMTVNCAHLTLHGLAGVAACVKSVAMGCASLRGKLRMHQSLLPSFDAALCAGCGRCVAKCPEDAIELANPGGTPTVDRSKCIGCGECEAVCALLRGAVVLEPEAITDWQRGEDTLPVRMADYTVGMMHGRWNRVVHVLFMHTVTERCDCIDANQRPMLGRDLGVLISRNPFALDRAAGALLTQTLADAGLKLDETLLGTAERTAAYARDTYGILAEPTTEKMQL